MADYGEPWKIESGSLFTTYGTSLGYCDKFECAVFEDNIAERIAACVNFCREFPTAFLTSHTLKQVPVNAGLLFAETIPCVKETL